MPVLAGLKDICYFRYPFRVVFTRENLLHFFCFLQSGNLSDSNNPLTKMHTLTHIGQLKFIVEKSMKCSTKFDISFLAIIFVLDKLNLAQNMAFLVILTNYNDQKWHDLSLLELIQCTNDCQKDYVEICAWFLSFFNIIF